MEKQLFDCIVIGSGPGGYVAAIRASQKGLKTALIEAREMGGTCLNRGCIPSKTLIANADLVRKIHDSSKFGISVGEVVIDYASMKSRKDGVVDKIRKGLEGLIASNKITVFHGFGKFISPYEVAVTGKDEVVLEGKSIIIATGSEPRPLRGIPFDYERIHDSTSFLNITKLPKKLVVVGGGVIGSEFACLHNGLGVEVTVLELLPQIISTEGKNISDFLTSSFKKQGIKIETNVSVQKIDYTEAGVLVYLADGRTLEADCALIATGRKLNTEGIGLERAGVIVEENGTIPTDSALRTNVPHIYAIGDITGKWILAHVASHQGIVAADNAAGDPTSMHYNAVPSVIFTHPEVGTVGLTLERALQAGFDATSGKFPFQALGKSQASIETEGFAQIVIEKSTGQILGAQAVGYDASNLISEMAVAIENELTVDSISDTIHAHPTLGEAWMEAALLASGTPLHLPPQAKRS